VSATHPIITSHTDFRDFLAAPEEILEDARNGRLFILVDDEDRENEGDLVIPAQMATPDVINFMAKYGRGLICLALTGARCQALDLPLMPQQNSSRHGTAFTHSIEAKEGVTTGISASDRAHTIAVAIDPSKDKNDIATPGHVFPLMARDGGVLVRAGHTEAAVDVARLAGLIPAGVICEIMNDDGSMARMPDLVAFAQHHGLKIGTIADLIAYRRRTERLVRREVESDFASDYGGDWRVVVYVNEVTGAEHLALVKGSIDPARPTLVRMHAINILDDLLHDARSGRGDLLHRAMDVIGADGQGVIVLIREAEQAHLSARVRARLAGDAGEGRLVDYGVGAQILLDLGVEDMILLSNTHRHIIALDGYGLRVVEQRALLASEGTGP
jgi:3,4-dihydroxy 2-butanone 4-phosphate synthase/GTP cyclohydrolase II